MKHLPRLLIALAVCALLFNGGGLIIQLIDKVGGPVTVSSEVMESARQEMLERVGMSKKQGEGK